MNVTEQILHTTPFTPSNSSSPLSRVGHCACYSDDARCCDGMRCYPPAAAAVLLQRCDDQSSSTGTRACTVSVLLLLSLEYTSPSRARVKQLDAKCGGRRRCWCSCWPLLALSELHCDKTAPFSADLSFYIRTYSATAYHEDSATSVGVLKLCSSCRIRLQERRDRAGH